MKNYKVAGICSLVAAICFLLSYFIDKEIIKLILACVWFLIAIIDVVKLKNTGKKKTTK